MDNEKYPYQTAWENYRDRQTLFILGFLGLIPFIFFFVKISQYLFNGTSVGGVDLRLAGFIFYALILGVLGLRLQFWKCPRCEKAFHNSTLSHNIFSSQCLHCKLPKYEGSNLK